MSFKTITKQKLLVDFIHCCCCCCDGPFVFFYCLFVCFFKGGFRGGPRRSRPPFCGLLNISALHVQYGIQAFAKFKRLECTRLHLRKLQPQRFSRRSMHPKIPRKVRRSQSWWALSSLYCHCILYPYAPSITKSSVRPCLFVRVRVWGVKNRKWIVA